MSYAQSYAFSEGSSRHESPEEKLWRAVITFAAQEAKLHESSAQCMSLLHYRRLGVRRIAGSGPAARPALTSCN